jgi:hypothetical protein
MASMSNYLENKLIDHLFRSTSFSAPTTLAVALCTAAPDDTSTGATITEVANSGSYARTQLDAGTSNWANTQASGTGASSGTGGTTSNSSTITFPTASGSWGTVTHIAIVDSATHGAGNVLFWGALSVSKTVSSGDIFTVAANQLTVQADN